MSLFSRKEKSTSADLMTINRLMEICQDSINLINNTANPDVFFGHWDLLIEKLNELSEYEKELKGIFVGEQPSEILVNLLSEKKNFIYRLVERSMNTAIRESIKLKTEKSQFNKLKKYFGLMEEYIELMDTENVEALKSMEHSFYNNTELFHRKKKAIENAQRHIDAGITAFRWSDSDDAAVRPSHRERNGIIFFYADDPLLPGEEMDCRCVAEPVFDDELHRLFPANE